MILFDYILGRLRKEDAGGGGTGLTPAKSIVENNGSIELQNDEATPSAFSIYGTDKDGIRGYHPLFELGGMGGEFQWKEDLTLSTSNSSTYTEKLKLTTTNLPASDYAIFYVVQVSTSDTDMEWRVQLNDTEDIVESAHTNGQFTIFSGFRVKTLSGVNTIDVDYNNAGGGQARIKNVTLFVFQVPENNL